MSQVTFFIFLFPGPARKQTDPKKQVQPDAKKKTKTKRESRTDKRLFGDARRLAPYAPLPQKRVRLNNQDVLETDFGRKCCQIERAIVDSVVS